MRIKSVLLALVTVAATSLPLAAFLHDRELRATVGKHTLLFGHALYASLLKEQRIEVLR